MVLFRYVEHDTLIWEYLNSSIHLVAMSYDIHLVADDIKHMVVLVMIIGADLSVIENTTPCIRSRGVPGEFQESLGVANWHNAPPNVPTSETKPTKGMA